MNLLVTRFACWAVCLILIVGCSGQDQKKQADESVIAQAADTLPAENIDTVAAQSNGSVQSQSDHALETEEAGEDIDMIRTFYNAHEAIWSISPKDISPSLFDKKLDSLAAKYCTSRLRNEASEWKADGHDLFTADWFVKFSTMHIERNPDKTNSFIVTFEIDVERFPPNDPQKKKVELRVQLIKELDGFKLDSVTGE